jgi:hypothetical protein
MEKTFKLPKYPRLYFGFMTIVSIITIPYWIWIKVESGLYEIFILDKNKKIYKKGYTYCLDEFRLARRKRILKDIRNLYKSDSSLPSRYSIVFKRNFDDKVIIWTSPTFTLDEKAIYSTSAISFNYPQWIIAKLKERLECVAKKCTYYLTEIVLLDKMNEAIAKVFVMTPPYKEDAYDIIKNELKERMMDEVKHRIKHIKIAYYKKEANHVIWAE